MLKFLMPKIEIEMRDLEDEDEANQADKLSLDSETKIWLLPK